MIKDIAQVCKRVGTVDVKGQGKIPLYSIGGGFMDTPEGWELWSQCREKAEEAMRPFHDARLVWEAAHSAK